MPNKNTFSIKPIKELLNKYISPNEKWIDAFSNSSKLATITNDLNPEYDTDYHIDALDFFKLFVKIILLMEYCMIHLTVSVKYQNVIKM